MKDTTAGSSGTRTCSNCKQTKSIDAFWRYMKGDGTYGFKSTCKDCARASHARWSSNNRDHVNQYQRDRLHADPDRFDKTHRVLPGKKLEFQSLETRRVKAVASQQRQRTSEPTTPETDALVEAIHRLHPPCVYCGSTEHTTVDHDIPISRGGKHDTSNIFPACLPCNDEKCDMTAEEFLLKRFLYNAGFRICPTCQKTLPLSAYNKNPTCDDGLFPACRDCQNARRRAQAAERRNGRSS